MAVKNNILKMTALLLLVFTACTDDDDWYQLNHPLDVRVNATAVFVVNEGNMMYDNASLSYYDIDSMKVLHKVFYRSNGELALGDVAQSMIIRDSLGYIVINNSGKVYVMNINTFEYMGKITGLTSPRYMHFINDNKAYITDLYAKSISIVNPVTLQVTGSIKVNNPASEYYQHPTEQMVQYDRFVFTNCWSYDNKVLVIDSETDELVDSIEVPKQPGWMVMDRNENIWVLTDGGFDGNPYANENAALVKINPVTRKIEASYLFPEEDFPSELRINGTGDTLYYLNRHVCRAAINSPDMPEVIIESPYQNSLRSGFYGLDIDPISSEVYVGDAIDHSQPGIVYRYRSNGIPVDTFSVGISPGAFCFKK